MSNKSQPGTSADHASDRATAPPPAHRQPNGQFMPFLPGSIVCMAAGLLAWALAKNLMPAVSPLLIAVLLGALWRNALPIPGFLSPGIIFSSKKLLRSGIVLLGLQLSLSSILELGPGVLLVVVLSVVVTFTATLWLGKLLDISLPQRLLIASGFSICGAAAVAATENATKAKEEEVATAIGLVVLFGTLMIPAVPFFGGLLGLPEKSLGLWIGASTHEVAQVVAAGGAVGSAALAVAVTVKLARVLMLAPIMASIVLYRRRSEPRSGGKLPPVVPLFILGFVAAMLLRTSDALPSNVLGLAQVLQTLLLSAAMFALGLGVHLRGLLRVGGRPVLLGLLSTLVILVISLTGTLIFPPA
ncbi:YeiH family protein [Arthrobacter sp. ZGTC131]|uniref:YeiH family protein n=1 Tax=Arthrobacter sp. ZGTC131 TaxID=2058898 RepID=UPI000CE53B74|nr:putative sulfate exporter family transporter [Arthrobacter sp. ZGTC131]